MLRLCWLVGIVRSKVGCRGWAVGRGKGGRLVGLGLAVSLLAAALVMPNGALGATCTDTWTSPVEGEWQVGGNWSLGSSPSSTDVACIGSGTTVLITGGVNQTGVLQDEGVVSISGGSLEVASGVEVSSVATLSLMGGGLVLGGELDISSSFTGGGFGTVKGTGSGRDRAGRERQRGSIERKFVFA